MKKGLDYTGITVVFCCHDGNGNILMHKRSQNVRDEHGRWDVGAGGLEFGEDPIDGLRREIREEYLAEVLEHEFLGYRSVVRDLNGTPTHWLALDFKVKVDPAVVGNGEPEAIDEVGWFTLATLPDPTHSQLHKFLDQYKNRL